MSDESIIEHALLRYPDIPILTTSEMEWPFADIDRVSTTNISHDELADNVDQKFEEMMAMTSATVGRAQTMLGVGAGTAAAGVVQLWPFVAAYMRGHITRDDLENIFVNVLGDQGLKLAGRVAMAAVFGPIYAWYLLARGVVGLTASNKSDASDDPSEDKQISVTKRLVYRPELAFTRVIAQSGVLASASSGDQIDLCHLNTVFELYPSYHLGQVVEAA